MRFGDETSERDGDQKRDARGAHAGSEKDEKQVGGDQAAGGGEKRLVAPIVIEARLGPSRALSHER